MEQVALEAEPAAGGACEQHAGVQFVTVLRRREQRPRTVEP